METMDPGETGKIEHVPGYLSEITRGHLWYFYFGGFKILHSFIILN